MCLAIDLCEHVWVRVCVCVRASISMFVCVCMHVCEGVCVWLHRKRRVRGRGSWCCAMATREDQQMSGPNHSQAAVYTKRGWVSGRFGFHHSFSRITSEFAVGIFADDFSTLNFAISFFCTLLALWSDRNSRTSRTHLLFVASWAFNLTDIPKCCYKDLVREFFLIAHIVTLVYGIIEV